MSDSEIRFSGRFRRIGDVARESGVATDTIRAWERRYQIVHPVRGPGEVRYYSADDLRRLIMVKGLVDAGESIGQVSGFADERLQEKYASLKTEGCLEHPWKVVSRNEPVWLREVIGKLNPGGVTWFSCLGELTVDLGDFLVIDIPSLSEVRAGEIIMSTAEMAKRTLVLYQFASRSELRNLNRRGYRLLKGPLDLCALMNHLA